MQPIDVRPQTQLSLARTFNLCLKGIRHRMFRSLLTTMVIILAVAFFMVLLADSTVARAVGVGLQAEVVASRRSAVATDLWFGKPAPSVIAERLAADQAPLAGYAGLTGWTPERIQRIAQACAAERTVVRWIDRLDAGTRAILVGVDRADEALPVLASDAGWAVFSREAGRSAALRPPMPLAEIREIARSGPGTAAEVAACASAWHGGVDALAAELVAAGAGADRDAWLAWIAEADDARRLIFAGLLATHGLGDQYAVATLASLQQDLRLDRLRALATKRLRSDEGRAAWMQAFGRQQPLDEKLLLLTDSRASTALGTGFTDSDRERLAAMVGHERDLAAKEANLVGKLDPDGGLVSIRQAFLIAISLVVCMVGIANAMLMAITERFREIATMKCLGATDGYILTQFLMEAGIQGAAGGAIGTAVGLLFSLIKGTWLFGSHLYVYFPVIGLLSASAVCIVAGLLLATLASIYPSWMASRMAPMEAMRVE